MRKREKIFLLAVFLLGISISLRIFVLPAQAAEGTVFEGQVQDDAGLLEDGEEEELEERCLELTGQYGTGIYIVTTMDFGGDDIKDWQRTIFEQNNLGAETNGDGIMLAISMSGRDWGLVAFGSAQEAFTTYGREKIGELILDDLSDEDFYAAFSEFLSLTDDYLKEAEEGTPYTEDHEYVEGYRIPMIIGISFVLSLAVSLIIVLTWKKGMNTRVRQGGAMAYLKEDSFRLHNRTDQFLYHRVTRTKIQKSESSGGGGMSSDSSGTSGKF